MFKKKAKEEPKQVQEVKQEKKEPEIIRKTVPNPEVAWTFVRQNLNDWVMGLCNLSKQEKTDINVCMEYLLNYIRGHHEIDALTEQINNKEIQNYSKSFEKNGYVVTIDIKKKK